MTPGATPMVTDDKGGKLLSLENIGKNAGLNAGYYKGKIGIKLFPPKGRGEPHPVDPAIREIMESWWSERNSGLTIYCLEGGKEKTQERG